jgi:hypothetical protein
MNLNRREQRLLNAFRNLSPEAAEELSALTVRLAALGSKTTIDWSDAWSEADLVEFAQQSLETLDEREGADC